MDPAVRVVAENGWSAILSTSYTSGCAHLQRLIETVLSYVQPFFALIKAYPLTSLALTTLTIGTALYLKFRPISAPKPAPAPEPAPTPPATPATPPSPICKDDSAPPSSLHPAAHVDSDDEKEPLLPPPQLRTRRGSESDAAKSVLSPPLPRVGSGPSLFHLPPNHTEKLDNKVEEKTYHEEEKLAPKKPKIRVYTTLKKPLNDPPAKQ